MHPPRSTGRRGPRLTTLLIAGGLLLVVTGAALFLTGRSFGFGWYDDAPGSDSGPKIPLATLENLVVMTPRLFWAERLIALGLVVVAGPVGYVLGRRR